MRSRRSEIAHPWPIQRDGRYGPAGTNCCHEECRPTCSNIIIF